MPTVEAHHIDGIYHRMALETLQRIDQHGFVIDIDELFGNVLPHPVAGAAGYNQSIVHILSFKFVLYKVKGLVEDLCPCHFHHEQVEYRCQHHPTEQ